MVMVGAFVADDDLVAVRRPGPEVDAELKKKKVAAADRAPDGKKKPNPASLPCSPVSVDTGGTPHIPAPRCRGDITIVPGHRTGPTGAVLPGAASGRPVLGKVHYRLEGSEVEKSAERRACEFGRECPMSLPGAHRGRHSRIWRGHRARRGSGPSSRSATHLTEHPRTRIIQRAAPQKGAHTV